MSDQPTNLKTYRAVAMARITLGAIFFWAFLDKLLGLGFATCRAENGVVARGCSSAWANGGSPTAGFLEFATKGPFADIFQSLAGNLAVDWLFMLGLLLIGLALIFGIGIKIAAVTGSVLMLMIWLSGLPPTNNPLLDEHIVYVFTLMIIYFTNSNQQFGFGRWWAQQKITKKYPILH